MFDQYSHLFLQYFNPMTLVGLGFVMHIEAFIEYLKNQWRLPGQLAPFVASLVSFIVQFAVCLFFKIPLNDALVGTIFTAAGACFWHELSTPTTTTINNNQQVTK